MRKSLVQFSSVVSEKEWLKSSVRLVSDNAQVRSITIKNLQISFYVHLQQTTTLVGKGQHTKCIYIKLTPLVMAAGNLDYKSKAYIDVDN